jgi:hypothetical protein
VANPFTGEVGDTFGLRVQTLETGYSLQISVVEDGSLITPVTCVQDITNAVVATLTPTQPSANPNDNEFVIEVFEVENCGAL